MTELLVVFMGLLILILLIFIKLQRTNNKLDKRLIALLEKIFTKG